MRSSFIMVALCILCLSTVGCNVTPTEFSEPGGYIGGSVMYGVDDFEDLDPTDDNDDDEVFGVGVRGGYRVAPWVGLEAAYEYFDEFDVSVADVKMQSLMLQGKLFPFTGRFQPYVLGGIGYVRGDVNGDTFRDFDEGDFSWRVGAGLDFYVIEMVPLFIEAAKTFPGSDLDELEYFTASLGAYLRF